MRKRQVGWIHVSLIHVEFAVLIKGSDKGKHIFMADHGTFGRTCGATCIAEGKATFRLCFDVVVCDVGL